MQDVFATDLPESIIKRYSIRVKELGGINLGQGIPSYPTPPRVIAAAKTALDDPGIGIYPNFLGTIELRNAIADRINTKYALAVSAEHHILITVGAMEAFASAMLSIIKNGDRVGVVTPDYCNHIPAIQLARGSIVEIPMIESDIWKPDLSAIESEAKKGLSALVLTNPGNPTGVVFDRATIDAIVALSNTYGFWLISDETYGYLDFESKFASLFTRFADCPRAVVINTFSKEYAMTGWRVGYLTAKPEIVAIIAKTHDALVGCVPKISQRAALAAITGPQDSVVAAKKMLLASRSIALSLADSLRPAVTYAKPEGAYYLFLKYQKKQDSMTVSQEILENTKVAVIPGIVFGRAGEGHIRISYAVEENLLKEGMKRIGEYFQK